MPTTPTAPAIRPALKPVRIAPVPPPSNNGNSPARRATIDDLYRYDGKAELVNGRIVPGRGRSRLDNAG